MEASNSRGDRPTVVQTTNTPTSRRQRGALRGCSGGKCDHPASLHGTREREQSQGGGGGAGLGSLLQFGPPGAEQRITRGTQWTLERNGKRWL